MNNSREKEMSLPHKPDKSKNSKKPTDCKTHFEDPKEHQKVTITKENNDFSLVFLITKMHESDGGKHKPGPAGLKTRQAQQSETNLCPLFKPCHTERAQVADNTRNGTNENKVPNNF